MATRTHPDPPVRAFTDDGWVAWLLAALPAVLLTFWLFPPSFLLGHGLFFQDGEINRDISGWLFFAQDSWQRPLLYTPWLNYPEGISIAFTNSIPLMALLFKPLMPLLPEGFHYFGLWHGVALLFQAWGAVFLVRSLGCLRAWQAVLAAGFAVIWPIWLFHFGHSGLLAQGILLWALGFMLRGQRGVWTTQSTTVALVLVCQLALLLHNYLLVMCYAIFVAWLFEQWRDSGRVLVQLVRLAASVALTLLLAAVLGFFGASTSGGAYGEQGLTLTSLWCGGYGAAWLNCNPGTGEHYAYLGFGVLLVIALALLWQGHRLPKALREYASLAVLSVVLVAFAMTHRVLIGDSVVAEFALPEWFLRWANLFDASARFVWPVAWLVFFVAFAALARKGWLGLIILVLALGLQWVDTTVRRDEIRIAARMPGTAPDPAWEPAMRGIAHVSMFPAFGCGEIDPFAYLPVQRIAALQNATFNTVHAPRLAANCEAKHARMQDDLREGQLHLAPAVLPAEALPRGMRVAAQHGQCKTLPIAPVLWGVARPQELLACRAEPADTW